MNNLATVSLSAMLVGVAGTAIAGDTPSDTTLLWHGTTPGYSGCAVLNMADVNCDNINANADLTLGQSFVWILFGNAPEEGLGAIQFGIEYDPTVQRGAWSLCTGGAEIPQDDINGAWPESGTGNAVTMAGGCLDVYENPDRIAKVGFFVVNGGEGEMRFTGDPRIPPGNQCIFTDCFPNLFRICPQSWGTLNVIGDPGYNPCGITCPVPVVESTWTGIKSTF